MDLFDGFESHKARDEGMERVGGRAGDWLERYLAMVTALPPGWLGIGEAFRKLMGSDQPHHPNAWGAAALEAIRRKLIVKTGRHLAMSCTTSHARMSPEYRRTTFRPRPMETANMFPEPPGGLPD